MARELLTSWGEFQAAIDRLLPLAQSKIVIYDGELSLLKLDSGQRSAHLNRLLLAGGPDRLRIALRSAHFFRHHCPRLMGLLERHPAGMSVRETPEHMGHLRDAMILVDDCHGLVLFESSQPRSKLLVDEMEELEPYLRRFESIWDEGGTEVGSTTLGL